MTAPQTATFRRVTEESVEIEFKRLMRERPANLSPEESAELIPKIKAQARELAVNRSLLLEEARRRNIGISDRELENIIANMIRQFGGRDKFERHLHGIGSSLEKAGRDIRAARLIEILTGRIVSAVPPPTDEEVAAYLKEHAPAENAAAQNPELLGKLKEKTGKLLLRLRQNRALNEFIAELRKQAGIAIQTAPSPSPDS